MSLNNAKTSESIAPVAIASGSLTTSTTAATSSYVLTGKFTQYYAIGTTAANGTGTVTVSILAASDTNGTGATAVVSGTASGTNAVNLPITLDFDADGAGYVSGKPYLAVLISVSAGTATANAILFGDSDRYVTALTDAMSGTVNVSV